MIILSNKLVPPRTSHLEEPKVRNLGGTPHFLPAANTQFPVTFPYVSLKLFVYSSPLF